MQVAALRAIVLAKLAIRHLVKHKTRQDAELLALGPAWQDYGLVFASSRIYTHVVTQLREDAADAIDRLLGPELHPVGNSRGNSKGLSLTQEGL